MLRYFLIVLFSLQLGLVHAECTQKVKVVFESITYLEGCDFQDNGGIDPLLELFDLNNGNRIYISYYDDQEQVTGPTTQVIDFSISDNWCGNLSNSFTLGEFPIDQMSYEIAVEIYEKDSNFLNPECSGYSILLDDNFESGNHSFDFNTMTGSIDIGACMIYNYTLEFSDIKGTIDILVDQQICPLDTVYINNIAYYNQKLNGEELILTPPNICDTLYDIQLSIFNLPQVNIIGPDSICPGEEIELVVEDLFETYLWSNGDTDDQTSIFEAGIYTIDLTTEDGCGLSLEKEIFMRQGPMPEINGNRSFCTGSSTTLSIGNFNTIEWSNDANSNQIEVFEAGVFSVTVTDQSGCTNSATIELIENPNPEITLTGEMTICPGGNTIISTQEDYAAYNWSTGENTPSIEVSEANIYSLIATDNNGCFSNIEFEIKQQEEQVIVIDSLTCDSSIVGEFDTLLTDSQGCLYLERLVISLEATTNCNYDYTVSFQNESCENSEDGSIEFEIILANFPVDWQLLNANNEVVREGIYKDTDNKVNIQELSSDDYLLKFIDQLGAVQMEIISINQEENPLESQILEVQQGEVVTLNMDIDTNLYSEYYWTLNGEFLCSPNCNSLEITPIQTETYQAYAFASDQNCAWTANVIVNVLTELNVYFPTIFNPKENNNNTFLPLLSDHQALLSFEIYDRWGNLKYRHQEGLQGWDGKFKGKSCAAGAYIFQAIILKNNTPTNFSGSITLIY